MSYPSFHLKLSQGCNENKSGNPSPGPPGPPELAPAHCPDLPHSAPLVPSTPATCWGMRFLQWSHDALDTFWCLPKCHLFREALPDCLKDSTQLSLLCLVPGSCISQQLAVCLLSTSVTEMKAPREQTGVLTAALAGHFLAWSGCPQITNGFWTDGLPLSSVGRGQRGGDSLDGRHAGCRHRADLLGLLQRVLLVKCLLFFLLILDTKKTWLCLGPP